MSEPQKVNLRIVSVRIGSDWRNVLRRIGNVDIICLQNVVKDAAEIQHNLNKMGYNNIIYSDKRRSLFAKPLGLLIASKAKILDANTHLFTNVHPQKTKRTYGFIATKLSVHRKQCLCIVNVHLHDGFEMDDVDVDTRNTRLQQVIELDSTLERMHKVIDVFFVCGLLGDSAVMKPLPINLPVPSEEPTGDTDERVKLFLESQLTNESHTFSPKNKANRYIVDSIMQIEQRKVLSVPGLKHYLAYVPLLTPIIARRDSNGFHIANRAPILVCNSISYAYGDKTTSEMYSILDSTRRLKKAVDPLVLDAFGYVPITDNDTCYVDIRKLGLGHDTDYILWNRNALQTAGQPMRRQYILTIRSDKPSVIDLHSVHEKINTFELDSITRLAIAFDKNKLPINSSAETHCTVGYGVVADVCLSLLK